jgi:transposase InsO family protein
MSHRNARLTPRGRLLLVQRVLDQGIPVAHVAAAMGVSRQCAHRWVRRFDREGPAGLEDRSSRPRRCPSATDACVVGEILEARRVHRCGPAGIARLCGVSERTVSRILRRAGRMTAQRYERAWPGELVHIDVKKLGRIPDGGGWRRDGVNVQDHPHPGAGRGGGYDFVHSMVDDHSRLAYSEILSDETGASCAGFLSRAALAFAAVGIERIKEVMTDNALAYRRSVAFRSALDELGARHLLIKAHCPWQNGKVERLNRTLQVEWAYRRPYTSNAERTAALAPWLERYNTERPHSALGGRPPISRLS